MTKKKCPLTDRPIGAILLRMNGLYYIPFFLFIIFSWLYFQRKMKRRDDHYNEVREQYLRERPELPSEQVSALRRKEPWIGMDSRLLTELFGEPHRKRGLDQLQTRFIWSYSRFFVYISDSEVAEWKKR